MDADDDTFHRGERLVQARAGLSEGVRHAIRDYMPDQHRQFFAQLPFVLVGSVDSGGQPWASALARPPGFLSSHDPHRLVVRAKPAADDPLAFAPGQRLGLLGIEPHTRRRNRLNGVVESVDGDGFSVRVQQSFGNCPKYIQSHKASFLPRFAGEVVRSDALDDTAVRRLRSADTFLLPPPTSKALREATASTSRTAAAIPGSYASPMAYCRYPITSAATTSTPSATSPSIRALGCSS